MRWLTERRRRRILAQPFPAAWDEIIDREVAISHRLDPKSRYRLRDLVQVFIAEKHWEGCGGLELTEEMQVVIAAQACVLVLGRDLSLYDDVASILIYPSAMRTAPRRLGLFEQPHAPIANGHAIEGEAHLGGPVIVAWDTALAGAREEVPGNVVFHELAHKLDMANGAIDGTPPLANRHLRRRWKAVCEAAFADLRRRVEAGWPSAIDAYGATNEAEFFAVATETFLTRPVELAAAYPALYELLAGFYRMRMQLQPPGQPPAGVVARESPPQASATSGQHD
ncbi:MAG: M90 family metallopeptidase [Kofleriaceae bacterium]